MTEQERNELHERIAQVKERVARAAEKAGKKPEDIILVAASKMNDAERVQEAIRAGIEVCGENRVQELLEKYEQNAYEGADLQFIGTLQTNKVKFLVGKVSLIQSVGSVHLGEAIAKEAAKHGIRQDILLEVNIGREQAKSGIDPDELLDAIGIPNQMYCCRIFEPDDYGILCEAARWKRESYHLFFRRAGRGIIPGVQRIYQPSGIGTEQCSETRAVASPEKGVCI